MLNHCWDDVGFPIRNVAETNHMVGNPMLDKSWVDVKMSTEILSFPLTLLGQRWVEVEFLTYNVD